jgi:hypothetical protein
MIENSTTYSGKGQAKNRLGVALTGFHRFKQKGPAEGALNNFSPIGNDDLRKPDSTVF